jgi:putative endopeptidase
MKENSKKFTNVKKLLVIFSLIICLTVSCKGKEENNNTPTPTADIQLQEKVEEPSATPVPDNNDTPQEITEISKQEPEEDQNTEDVEEEPVNKDLYAEPWINSDLKENLTKNMELSPKEDFHLYVNYDWLKNAEIPAGYRFWSFTSEVNKTVEDKEKALITDENMEGHDVELIRDYYNAILDWDERNKTGLTPMIQLIDEIQAIQSLEELTKFICDKDIGNCFSRFINVNIEPAVSDSSRYIVAIRINNHIGPEGETSKPSGRQQTSEKKFVSELMKLAGYDRAEAAQMYDAVVSRIEPFFYYEQIREVKRGLSPYEGNVVIMSSDEIKSLTKEFPLMRVLDYYGVADAEQYEVFNTDIIKNLDRIYTESDLAYLKRYLIVTCVMKMGPHLNQDADKLFDDYYKSLYGISEVASDEDFALRTVVISLGTPFYKAYLQKYHATKTKERVKKLIKQIIDEYRLMLSEEDWLSESTKKYAIEKLDNINIGAVYPPVWDDFSDLDIKGLSYLDAIQKINDYKWQVALAKIGRTCSHTEWRNLYLTTNAFYDPLYNSIIINYGIVDGDFYYDGISDEELYAGLGTIIGHEISHAFDSNGALYDKNGDYVNWWTEEDYKSFEEKTDKLIKYYNNITVWLNGYVNGNRVCGEAIADIAGMKVILKMAEKIPDF